MLLKIKKKDSLCPAFICCLPLQPAFTIDAYGLIYMAQDNPMSYL